MLVYLDSSAIVKLILLEPETRALFSHLRDSPDRITSSVAAVEVPRAIRRGSSSSRALARAEDALSRIDLIDLDEGIRARAARLDPIGLKSLDAIHLSTALELGAELTSFATYDRQQAAAARQAGLNVVSPARA